MANVLVHALLGASVAVAIAVISRTAVGVLVGLVALFPTFAVYAHLQSFAIGGALSVKKAAVLGLLALLPYAIYLSATALLVDRLGCYRAITLALACWLFGAVLVVLAWYRLPHGA